MEGDIKEVFLNAGRFYVRIECAASKTGIRTLKRANHNWLTANPSFKAIPKGYIVHHLDQDGTNDDPSNLVIMYKLHHMAYHLKQKTITTDIPLAKEARVYMPTKYPHFCWDKNSRRFYVGFSERDESDAPKKVRLFRFEGEPMKTEEAAKACCRKVWEDAWGSENLPDRVLAEVSG